MPVAPFINRDLQIISIMDTWCIIKYPFVMSRLPRSCGKMSDCLVYRDPQIPMLQTVSTVMCTKPWLRSIIGVVDVNQTMKQQINSEYLQRKVKPCLSFLLSKFQIASSFKVDGRSYEPTATWQRPLTVGTHTYIVIAYWHNYSIRLLASRNDNNRTIKQLKQSNVGLYNFVMVRFVVNWKSR